MPTVLGTFMCYLIKVLSSLTMQVPCCPLVERGHRSLEGLPESLASGHTAISRWSQDSLLGLSAMLTAEQKPALWHPGFPAADAWDLIK